jgi:DNA-binding transcriptional LysR family regulator
VVLLERTTRSVALTAAGAVLLEEARAALEAVAAAGHRAARAGQPDRRLVVAIKADGDGGQLPAIIAAYERDRPPCRSW